MKKIQEPWIKAGYTLFSSLGPKGVQIEVLSRIVGKNKSSFYHHFSDLDTFIELLLEYHLERAKIVVEAEKKCNNIIPELLTTLVRYKEDLLFDRQLRVHKNIPAFEACFVKANQGAFEAVSEIWAIYLKLDKNSKLSKLVLQLSIENLYLNITEENFTYEWLEQYLINLKNLTQRALY